MNVRWGMTVSVAASTSINPLAWLRLRPLHRPMTQMLRARRGMSVAHRRCLCTCGNAFGTPGSLS
eukprot:9719785-Alexandrium_andersonii.AAC.1